MPAVSKQQRKFMGLVHAVQKGEVPASKVSKSARDAAKQMKKKDVEDFASTDEKGLPKKKQNEAKWRVMYDIIKSNDTISINDIDFLFKESHYGLHHCPYTNKNIIEFISSL